MARATKISKDGSFLELAENLTCGFMTCDFETRTIFAWHMQDGREKMDEKHRCFAFYTPLITAPESTAATASIVRVAKPVLFNML